MAKQWFIVKYGTQYGPMTSEELKRKAESGELEPNDRVRPDGRQDWFKASAVKGLLTSAVGENVPQSNGAEATADHNAIDGKQEDHLVRNVAIVAGVATALFVVVILVPFAMRDTWEIDNAERVSAKLEEADRLQQSDPPTALKIYDEILAEAKQHKLTNEQLSRRMDLAEKSQGALCQKVQEQVRADQAEKQRQSQAAERRTQAPESDAFRMALESRYPGICFPSSDNGDHCGLGFSVKKLCHIVSEKVPDAKDEYETTAMFQARKEKITREVLVDNLRLVSTFVLTRTPDSVTYDADAQELTVGIDEIAAKEADERLETERVVSNAFGASRKIDSTSQECYEARLSNFESLFYG